MVCRIAPGEIQEGGGAASALGKRGGKAGAATLRPVQRS
jgi:hypothetical protein